MIKPVSFDNVKITDSFWSPRLMTFLKNTLPTCIDFCENKTARIRNFENADTNKLKNGESEKHEGICFDDSDVYKILEGIGYTLCLQKDSELERKADEWIQKIAASQWDDGYLMTFYSLSKDRRRWTDISMHEMYCAGHMLEGAIAYAKGTGKTLFLETATRVANHIMETFGSGKRHWVPGHEEIELALIKLYRHTGDKKYLDLAHFLLEERGKPFSDEHTDKNHTNPYWQDDVPVRDIEIVKGHAVRAMYLFTGMADYAAATGDNTYIPALKRVWDNVVNKNMYITGGIGSTNKNEGFTTDYDLPNQTAYCETCAAIGLVLWASRMNIMTGDATYADIIERALYNGVLSGISLDGKKFFYVNPLESQGNHHREEWFGCACCPSNLARFIPSIGNYIYCVGDDGIYINLYIQGETELDGINIRQQTEYPFGNAVYFEINADKIKKKIKIRFPGWAKSVRVTVDDADADYALEKGYIIIEREWNKNFIKLEFDMPVECNHANKAVIENTGKIALTRGPLVYCFEETDNPSYDGIAFRNQKIVTEKSDELGSIIKLKIYNGNDDKDGDESEVYTAVPYYSWDNRTHGRMKVWIDYNPDTGTLYFI